MTSGGYTMKEAAKLQTFRWEVTGDYLAERTDGVIAKCVFSGKLPYAVMRRLKKPRKVPFSKRVEHFEWMAGRAKSCRTFGTLKAAMDAADKTWPL